MKKAALVIDEKLCWGCKTCEAACKQEHKAPFGVKRIEVVEEKPKPDSAGKLSFTFRVRRCLHCEEPECVAACPTEALAKRPDGIVTLCASTCIGCGACIEACPFDAIAFNKEANVAVKCDLCVGRITAGLYPACADNVCPAHCIAFSANAT